MRLGPPPSAPRRPAVPNSRRPSNRSARSAASAPDGSRVTASTSRSSSARVVSSGSSAIQARARSSRSLRVTGRPVEGRPLVLRQRERTADVRTLGVVVGGRADPVGEALRVVLRVVAEQPAGLEVPPAAGVRGDAVDDGEAGVGRRQAGVEHPHRVVVRQPRRQPAHALRLRQEAADAGGDGVDRVAVGVQAQQRLRPPPSRRRRTCPAGVAPRCRAARCRALVAGCVRRRGCCWRRPCARRRDGPSRRAAPPSSRRGEASSSGSEASPGRPARCTTASSAAAANTASTASGSPQSAVNQSPAKPSGSGTRSRPTTEWPRSRSPLQSTVPIDPAAPVTSTRMPER